MQTKRLVQTLNTKQHPKCPKCSSKMNLLQKMTYDTNGVYEARITQWWGCENYPKCKGYLNPKEAKSMLGQEFRKEKKKIIRHERTMQAIENIRALFSKKGHINYYQYINSPEWKQKSDKAKERARYKCQVCNRSSWEVVLNTHHRTYQRLGYEMEEDLIVLCHECHNIFHKNGKIASYKK